MFSSAFIRCVCNSRLASTSLCPPSSRVCNPYVRRYISSPNRSKVTKSKRFVWSTNSRRPAIDGCESSLFHCALLTTCIYLASLACLSPPWTLCAFLLCVLYVVPVAVACVSYVFVALFIFSLMFALILQPAADSRETYNARIHSTQQTFICCARIV